MQDGGCRLVDDRSDVGGGAAFQGFQHFGQGFTFRDQACCAALNWHPMRWLGGSGRVVGSVTGGLGARTAGALPRRVYRCPLGNEAPLF